MDVGARITKKPVWDGLIRCGADRWASDRATKSAIRAAIAILPISASILMMRAGSLALITLSLGGCAHRFDEPALGTGGASTTASAAQGSGLLTSSQTNSAQVASGSTVGSNDTVAVSSSDAASSSSTGSPPVPFSPCGGASDDFNANELNPRLWRTNVSLGEVTLSGGRLELKALNFQGAFAAVEQTVTPLAPCAFGFDIASQDDVSLSLRHDQSSSIGLSYAAADRDLWLRRNFQDVSVLVDNKRVDAFAIVLTSADLCLMGFFDATDKWHAVHCESLPDWTSQASAAVFNPAAGTEAHVDDYAVRPIFPDDLTVPPP